MADVTSETASNKQRSCDLNSADHLPCCCPHCQDLCEPGSSYCCECGCALTLDAALGGVVEVRDMESTTSGSFERSHRRDSPAAERSRVVARPLTTLSPARERMT